MRFWSKCAFLFDFASVPYKHKKLGHALKTLRGDPRKKFVSGCRPIEKSGRSVRKEKKSSRKKIEFILDPGFTRWGPW